MTVCADVIAAVCACRSERVEWSGRSEMESEAERQWAQGSGRPLFAVLCPRVSHAEFHTCTYDVSETSNVAQVDT